MEREFIKAWVAALRSGTYQQTCGMLRSRYLTESFCCLGVAQDLLAKEHPTRYYWEEDHEHYRFVDAATGEESSAVLVPAANELIGLEGTGPVYLDGLKDRSGDTLALTTLNDEGCTFSQIADVIEYVFLNN